jgi:two-component response regulator ARR-B family
LGGWVSRPVSMRAEERDAAVGRVRDQFPVSMRVLAVDDDPVCLKVLENLLRRCQYHSKDFCATGL